MKKLLLTLFALGMLFLTGCYESITGYKLVGEYQSPAPVGYWDGSKLNYDKDGGLKLSIALGESALSDFSTPQLNEVKLPGKIALSVANTIRKEPWPDFAKLNPDKLTLADVIKISPFLSGIYSGQISPGFCLIYDKSQLKSIAVFAKKSYLQILNPKSLSAEKEIKIETNSLNFVSKLACSDDLQYLAIAYHGIGSFYHTIDIYKLNQESNTYQFRNRFDQYSKHYREMSFDDMKIDNGLLMIKLNKGARRTIKTSRILFYNLKKNLIESVYALRDVSFVNSAAVTPDLEYLIIVKESLKLYRRNSKNTKDK